MGGDFSVDALQGPGSERQASENRERRSQILGGQIDFSRQIEAILGWQKRKTSNYSKHV